jgi:hypothetical protein
VHKISIPGPKDVRPKLSKVSQEPHSPILEHVCRLCADEQDKHLTKMGKTTHISANEQAQMRDSKEPDSGKKKEEEKHHDTESIPDMESELSDSDCAKALYAIPEPPSCVLFGENFALPLSLKSKEFDALARAVDEMWVFQNIKSSPPQHRSYKHKSAIHSLTELEAGNVGNNDSGWRDVDGETNDDIDSDEVEEYERLETATKNESEHNGARRKWYKGYRR